MSNKLKAARKQQPSSVRHTRAVQRDRSKRPTVAPSAPQVEAHLAALIQPATFAQVASFQALGLRERILTLPVMVAFVLSLIWRHLGSVAEATRVLRQEGFLWVQPHSGLAPSPHRPPRLLAGDVVPPGAPRPTPAPAPALTGPPAPHPAGGRLGAAPLHGRAGPGWLDLGRTAA